MVKFPKRIISSLLFLTASEQRVQKSDPKRFSQPACAMMLLNIAFGLILGGIWSTTYHVTWVLWRSLLDHWAVFPSAVCGLVMVFVLYRQSAAALIEPLTGKSRPARWIGLTMLAVGVYAILNYSFRQSNPDWPTQLPQQWSWLWPRPICRVLLLAPVWGAWSMVVLGQFHRPGDRTDPPAKYFAETVSPIASAACLSVPLAGSLLLLNFMSPWRHFIPPAAAVAAALAAGTLIVRQRGEISRKTLLATNFMTQLGFLVAYLIVR